MKSDADETTFENLVARPDWSWQVVAYKAFITLFVIGGWAMIFMWVLIIGALFGPVAESIAVAGRLILAGLMNALLAWALFTFSVSIWTERQHWALRAGIMIGVALCSVMVFKSVNAMINPDASIAVFFYRKLTLPFCLLTLACLLWELWRQFRPLKTKG